MPSHAGGLPRARTRRIDERQGAPVVVLDEDAQSSSSVAYSCSAVLVLLRLGRCASSQADARSSLHIATAPPWRQPSQRPSTPRTAGS